WVAAVCHAVFSWSQRLVEEADAADRFSVAATLIGSGGKGVTVAESAQMVAKGVQEANDRLDDEEDSKRWPRVEHLTLIELYRDRATEAWRALTLQAASSPASYVVTGAVQTRSGGLRRLLDA